MDFSLSSLQKKKKEHKNLIIPKIFLFINISIMFHINSFYISSTSIASELLDVGEVLSC